MSKSLTPQSLSCEVFDDQSTQVVIRRVADVFRLLVLYRRYVNGRLGR